MAVVSCTIALVTSYGLLTCMFAPEMYFIFGKPEKNTKEFLGNEPRTANNIVPAGRF